MHDHEKKEWVGGRNGETALPSIERMIVAVKSHLTNLLLLLGYMVPLNYTYVYIAVVSVLILVALPLAC